MQTAHSLTIRNPVYALPMHPTKLPATRVFLIDRSDFVCHRLTALLAGTAIVVGYACNPADAVAGINRHLPDVVVVDMAVAEVDGFRLLKQLSLKSHPMVVIVLAEQTEDAFRQHCLRLGAHYFLDKTHDFESVQCIISSRQSAGNANSLLPIPAQGATQPPAVF